ncbi:MAG TPA: hypothetical protein VK634_19655 [Reyranella sp.]|nr:hypothetical protein [Reyranella sp.]HTE82911.1 hypothetical protein [Reyranella sp.]
MTRQQLRNAIEKLDELLTPASPRTIRAELGQLMFVTHPASLEGAPLAVKKAFIDQMMADYVPLLAHLPADVIASAATSCARRSKFYPMPAELLEFAAPMIAQRHDMRRRAIQLLGDLDRKPADVPRETPAQRIRHLRDLYLTPKFFTPHKANRYEQELAALEGREPVEFKEPIGEASQEQTASP